MYIMAPKREHILFIKDVHLGHGIQDTLKDRRGGQETVCNLMCRSGIVADTTCACACLATEPSVRAAGSVRQL